MQENAQTFYKILPSGVKIVLRNEQSEVSYVGIMVGAGTRHETTALNGMAHYIEHCVFKGAKSPAPKSKVFTAKDIILQIEGIGGEINAYTTKEETTFYAATPRQYTAKTLQLLLDMVRRPIFPHDETKKELGVIYDEIESYKDSPSELIYDDFESLIFNNHSLAMPILGTRKTLRQLSRKPQTALSWIEEHYQPNKFVIFLQGNFTQSTILRIIEQEFAEEACASPMLLPPEQSLPYVADSATYKRNTHQTHVMLGGRAYPLGHPKQLTLYLLNNILGGGSLNSRLNMSIREQKGLVYTIESTYTPLSDTGYWCIYFASEPQNTEECLQRIYRELRLLRDKPLTPHQLQRAILQIRGQMAISAENRENTFLTMGKQMLYYSNTHTWQETFERIKQITAEQIQEVAREVYDERQISVLKYL